MCSSEPWPGDNCIWKFIAEIGGTPWNLYVSIYLVHIKRLSHRVLNNYLTLPRLSYLQSSTTMAAPIPAGTYIITSAQYPDNAANLYQGNADSNIIRYPEHGKLNQQVRAISR